MIDHQNHTWTVDIGPIHIMRASDLIFGQRVEALFFITWWGAIEFSWKPKRRVRFIPADGRFEPPS
jgi:hypothetical protein